jgi:hypothetical protein
MSNAGSVRVIAWPVWAALAVLAIYLPVAYYLQSTFVPSPQPIYPRFSGGGFAFVMRAPEFDQLADSSSEPNRSPVVLTEDAKPLGPAHSKHPDISRLGHGRFSHWQGIGIVFSTGDNSDPNKNGRRYSLGETR